MIATRIAIWDKNRIIMAVAFGMWGTNIVFLIQGKFYPLPELIESLIEIWNGIRRLGGEYLYMSFI
jgi:hypothetical protein